MPRIVIGLGILSWVLIAMLLITVEGKPASRPAPQPTITASAKPKPKPIVKRTHHAKHQHKTSRSYSRCDWLDPKACGKNQRIGIELAADRGWTGEQWVCLKRLWYKESGWSARSGDPQSAFGIPQALPGTKMAAAGPNWRTDAATQIRWGLGYISKRYGSPCAAWAHWQSHNWY